MFIINIIVNDFNIPQVDKLTIKSRGELKGHLAKIYGLAWSNDNRHIVSAGQDGKLIVWNALKRYKVSAADLQSNWVMTCAYSPSGNFVASGGLDNVCAIYSVDSNTPVLKLHRQLQGHSCYISCCKFLTDKHILTSSGDSTCVLWDIDRARAVQTFHGHLSDVMSLSVAPDQHTFVSGSCDFSAKLWDTRQGKCAHTFEGHTSDINYVDFFPNGLGFATGSDDTTCRLFDIRAGGELQIYKDKTIKDGVTSISFSNSGRLFFAAYDDNRVIIWDTLTGTILKTLNDHSSRVSCLAVSPDGNVLCTGSWDHTLRLWA